MWLCGSVWPECGHEIDRNCLDIPGGNSGLRQSGIMGSGVDEREYLMPVS